MLDFDFFELLDSVTIARSRKHIQKYYDTSDIGTFPTRNIPISKRPGLTDIDKAINDILKIYGKEKLVDKRNQILTSLEDKSLTKEERTSLENELNDVIIKLVKFK